MRTFTRFARVGLSAGAMALMAGAALAQQHHHGGNYSGGGFLSGLGGGASGHHSQPQYHYSGPGYDYAASSTYRGNGEGGRVPSNHQNGSNFNWGQWGINFGVGMANGALNSAHNHHPNHNQPNFNTQPNYPTQPSYPGSPNYTPNYPSNYTPNYPSANNSYYPPANTLPAANNAAPPRNTLPPPAPQRNTIVRTVPPLGSGGLSLTQDQADAAADDLAKQADEKFERFQKEEQNLQGAMDQIRTTANGPGVKPSDGQAISAAIDARNPQKLQQAMLDAGAPPDVAAAAAANLNTLDTLERLDKVMHNGGTTQEIAQASQEYLQAEHASVIAQSKIQPGLTAAKADAILQADQDHLNDIIALKAGADALQAGAQGTLNGPSGQTGLPDPNGQLIATWVPWLPAGQTVAVGPQMVMLGTGPGGALASGCVTPAQAGLPVVPGSAVPPASAAAGGTPVVFLQNPADAQGPISYLLNDQNHTMPPGSLHSLPTGTWNVRFDRGGGNGTASYNNLAPGLYRFIAGNKGWDLYSATVEVTLDNSANAYDFHFLLGDQAKTVPARQTLALKNSGLLTVRFDDGTGQSRQKLLDSGTYAVGVDPASQQLDLFRGPAMPTETDAEPDRSVLALNPSLVTFGTAEGTAAPPVAVAPPAKLTPIKPTDLRAPVVIAPPKRLLKTPTAG